MASPLKRPAQQNRHATQATAGKDVAHKFPVAVEIDVISLEKFWIMHFNNQHYTVLKIIIKSQKRHINLDEFPHPFFFKFNCPLTSDGLLQTVSAAFMCAFCL